MNIKNLIMWVIIVLLSVGLFNMFQDPNKVNIERNSLAFSNFLNEVDAGRVIEVQIQGNNITGVLADGKTFKTYSPNYPELVEKLSSKGVSIVATPTESNDVERANVVSMFLRWLINSKMQEFYPEVELGLNHLFEKGMMVHYCWYENQELKQQQTISLEEIAQVLPQIAGAIQDGSMDEELTEVLKTQFDISKSKARAMLKEMRKDGETTVPVTRQVVSRPKIKTLAPDEDVFWPSYCIDPQEAPYMFHVVSMTPEQLRSKISTEKWSEEFVDAAIEIAGQGEDTDENIYQLRENDEFTRSDDNSLVRIVYCYQRLLDEDNVPGIYCTIYHANIPDLYAKHQLLDYQHGQYPFIVTTLEKTDKKLYSSRSYPELIESLQQVLKVETDAAIDAQSLTTLPPLEHPLGGAP